MREIARLHDGNRRICTIVFGMTIAACQFGVVLVHRTMQSDYVLHLLRDLTMTVDTQVSHGSGRPRRAVAGIALSADLGM